MEENKVEAKEKEFTRDEILAMKPGYKLDSLYNRVIFGIHYGEYSPRSMPHYSTDKSLLPNMLYEEGKSGNYFGLGLFIAPLNNGQWVCGRAVKIYNIKITDDHYQDKKLIICDTSMEAACKMRLILALCSEEAVDR